jgi:hypothetical protein
MIKDADLDALIEGLFYYKEKGVDDPWILEDGTVIEPLDILVELRDLRKRGGDIYGKKDSKEKRKKRGNE